LKLDILAFAAHPDDVELGCSGTLIKHQLAGMSTGIIDLTQGELGTRGSAELRALEAKKSSEILKLSARENLGFLDGFFKNDREHLLPVIQKIRKYQPDIVLANAIEDRHPDHGRAARLVADACFYAGLIKIKTYHEDQSEQSAWRPKSLFHYIQYNHIKPDFLIDVSEVMDKKIEAIMAYSSQFYDPQSKEPETPISSLAFFNSLRERAADLGRMINVSYAEGFTATRLFGISSLKEII
jgi:bacillithiol biosynthesis deacetylase BshB1